MQRNRIVKIATLFVLTLSFFSCNLEKEDDATKAAKQAERKAYIQHHLQDSYDFNLFSYKKEDGHKAHVGFPLPVILWDNGLQMFSSSKFHHGETVAEVNGNHYKLYHGKIYKTDASGTMTYDEADKDHPTNAKPLDFSVTKRSGNDNFNRLTNVFLI